MNNKKYSPKGAIKWTGNNYEINAYIYQFYQHLYNVKQNAHKVSINMWFFKWPNHSFTYMEQYLSCKENLAEKEIYNSLKSFENNKSPLVMRGSPKNFNVP